MSVGSDALTYGGGVSRRGVQRELVESFVMRGCIACEVLCGTRTNEVNLTHRDPRGPKADFDLIMAACPVPSG